MKTSIGLGEEVLLRLSLKNNLRAPEMTPPPGPYSGKSTLALVARASAFSFGLVYGSIKLKVLKAKAKSASKAHH